MASQDYSLRFKKMMTLFLLWFYQDRQMSLTDAVCNTLSQTRARFCSSHILQTFNWPPYYRTILATWKGTFSIWMIHAASHCFWMAIFAYSCFKIIFLVKDVLYSIVFQYPTEKCFPTCSAQGLKSFPCASSSSSRMASFTSPSRSFIRFMYSLASLKIKLFSD